MNGGMLLLEARRRAGLTQRELARRAGTSQAAISAYEQGRKDPSIRTLSRLLAEAGASLRLSPEPDLNHRARALVDVLRLAEALPSRPEPELRYPRLPSRR